MRGLAQLAILFAALSSASADKVAKGGALDPLHREVQPDADAAHHALKPVKLTVVNKVGKPVHAVVVTSAGSPSIGHSQLVHDKFHTTIPKFAAGHVTLGHNTDDNGSKIEISNDAPPAPTSETEVYVNVSFVDGFSLPIVCHCAKKSTGCAKNLFKHGNCPKSRKEGPVCLNNAPDNGPPENFFKPCRDDAYVFPNQSGKGTGMYCPTYEIECCVGEKCGDGHGHKAEDDGSTPSVAQAMADRRGLVADAEAEADELEADFEIEV